MGDLHDHGAFDQIPPICPLGAQENRHNIGGIYDGGVDVDPLAGESQIGKKDLHDRAGGTQQRDGAGCTCCNGTNRIFSRIAHDIGSPSFLILLLVCLSVLTGGQTGLLLEEPDKSGDVAVADLCGNILQ